MMPLVSSVSLGLFDQVGELLPESAPIHLTAIISCPVEARHELRDGLNALTKA